MSACLWSCVTKSVTKYFWVCVCVCFMCVYTRHLGAGPHLCCPWPCLPTLTSALNVCKPPPHPQPASAFVWEPPGPFQLQEEDRLVQLGLSHTYFPKVPWIPAELYKKALGE